MGGDGGVVATNRRYMRGAGSADHTADSNRASALDVAESERERLQQAIRNCAITGTPFDFTPPSDDLVDGVKSSGSQVSHHKKNGGIVVCPYGRLYTREAAVQALLRRMEQHGSQPKGGERSECMVTPEIGWHIRGLKDLYAVRFHVVEQSSNGARVGNGSGKRVFLPACPIVGIDLNGLQPTYVITNKKKKKKKRESKGGDTAGQESEGPNVICEKALKEMGFESLQEEYGPFQKKDLIRLAPPSGKIFGEIQNALTLQRNMELSKTSDKKRKNKVGHGGNNDEAKQKKIVSLSEARQSKKACSSISNSSIGGGSTVDIMRRNVAAAVASSTALSSLFEDKSSHLTEEEKKNNLFVR